MNRRTLSNAGAWVSAVGAGVLLDVHRAAAWMSQYQSAYIPSYRLSSPRQCPIANCAIHTFRLSPSLLISVLLDLPQRLHRTCVLLWRFPKLDVPLAIVHCQHGHLLHRDSLCVRRTHFGGVPGVSVVLSMSSDSAGCRQPARGLELFAEVGSSLGGLCASTELAST